MSIEQNSRKKLDRTDWFMIIMFGVWCAAGVSFPAFKVVALLAAQIWAAAFLLKDGLTEYRHKKAPSK